MVGTARLTPRCSVQAVCGCAGFLGHRKCGGCFRTFRGTEYFHRPSWKPKNLPQREAFQMVGTARFELTTSCSQSIKLLNFSRLFSIRCDFLQDYFLAVATAVAKFAPWADPRRFSISKSYRIKIRPEPSHGVSPALNKMALVYARTLRRKPKPFRLCRIWRPKSRGT